MKTHLIQPQDLFGPPERQEELRECWRRNEGLFDQYTHPEGRPTFSALFAMCKPNAINILANSDLYFDEDGIETLKQYFSYGITGSISAVAFALSRWDVGVDGSAILWDHPDSQDCFIVFGGPHVVDCPIPMGVAGVDNRLVHCLRQAGFTVTNPSKAIKAFHLHNVQWRSYLADPEGRARGGDKPERVPPPYAFCKPTAL